MTLFPLILLAALALKDFLDCADVGRGRPRMAVFTLVSAALMFLGLVNASETILPYHR